MHRRLLISAMACWAAPGLFAQEEPARPHQKISASQLRKALATRFPARFVLPGLVDVQVNVPRLLLLPALQRLGGTVPATITDLAARRVHSCEMDLLFALRWNAADQTLRAHDIEIAGLRSPALPPATAQAWQALLQNMARSTLAELVLHQFSPADLGLADLLGLQPEKITVEADGLEIWFGPKGGG